MGGSIGRSKASKEREPQERARLKQDRGDSRGSIRRSRRNGKGDSPPGCGNPGCTVRRHQHQQWWEGAGRRCGGTRARTVVLKGTVKRELQERRIQASTGGTGPGSAENAGGRDESREESEGHGRRGVVSATAAPARRGNTSRTGSVRVQGRRRSGQANSRYHVASKTSKPAGNFPYRGRGPRTCAEWRIAPRSPVRFLVSRWVVEASASRNGDEPDLIAASSPNGIL